LLTTPTRVGRRGGWYTFVETCPLRIKWAVSTLQLLSKGQPHRTAPNHFYLYLISRTTTDFDGSVVVRILPLSLK
jgi:hypothetical protein